MKRNVVCAVMAALAVGAFRPAISLGQELLTNPGFESGGSGWGKFGNTDFNTFFGPNGEASFFADTIGNSGGVFQQGIAGYANVSYAFSLTDTRIETNFDATLRFGLEYYAANDSTKLGETIVVADTSTPGDGLVFNMTGVAVNGTVFVRPIIEFDSVQTTGGPDRNAFVFEASLEALPEPGAIGAFIVVGSMAALRRRRTR